MQYTLDRYCSICYVIKCLLEITADDYICNIKWCSLRYNPSCLYSSTDDGLLNPFHAFQVPSFCLLPSGYLIVCFVLVSVCASIQLEMHRPENRNKITDVRALTCTTFHFIFNYPPTKWEGYSFGFARLSIPSVHTFCLSGTISQYLLLRFDSFLVQIISTMNSRYPISLVKIDPLTLELLPLF